MNQHAVNLKLVLYLHSKSGQLTKRQDRKKPEIFVVMWSLLSRRDKLEQKEL